MSDSLESLITAQLPYRPNDQQRQVISALARFCGPGASDEQVFLLNGYAGTGKTSLCAALVRALPATGMQTMLLAPTGRAAKVFSGYAGRQAFTIHRVIYRHMPTGAGDFGNRETRENSHRDTVFIVDEASMISTSDGGSNLLEDLIHYVYTGTGCRMILLGDTAQLPPVGCDRSPAMDPDTLRSYGLRVSRATLTETARQASDSGILRQATWLRRAMRQDPPPLPRIFPSADVREVATEDVPEDLYTAYAADGVQESIVITRSNQRAVAFNREIRASVLYLEEELAVGEMLVVSKNNYFWTSPSQVKKNGGGDDAAASRLPAFVANGDVLEVTHVYGREHRYGFSFADVEVTLPSASASFRAKVMLDSLNVETAGIPQERMHALYYAIMEDPELFGPYTPADVRLKALRVNPYWNALHVKYAYALTCHKAQGGQWRNVFVDMAYIPAEAMGMEFYRWLYTAVTRTTGRLYIIR